MHEWIILNCKFVGAGLKKTFFKKILWILTSPNQNEVKYSDNKCSYSKNLQKAEKQRKNKAKVCNQTKTSKS